MNCAKSRHYISALTDQQLEAKLQTQLEDHLDVCESCTQFFLQCQQINHWVRPLKTPALSPHFAQKCLVQFQQTTPPPVMLSFSYRYALSLAAIVLLFLFLGYRSPQKQPHSSLTTQEVAEKVEDFLQLTEDLFPMNIAWEQNRSSDEFRLLYSELKETRLLQKTKELLSLANSSQSDISSQLAPVKNLLYRIERLYSTLEQNPAQYDQLAIQYKSIFQKIALLRNNEKEAPRRHTPVLPRKKYLFENATPEEQQLLLAKQYLLEENYSSAIQLFRQFRNKFPDSKYQGKAQFFESVALERLGKKMASFHLFAQIKDPVYLPSWKIAEYEEEFYENNPAQIWLSENNQDDIPQIHDPVFGPIFTQLKLRVLQHYKKEGKTIVFIQFRDKRLDPHSSGTQLLEILQKYPAIIQLAKTTATVNPQKNIEMTSFKIQVQWKEFQSCSNPNEQNFLLNLQQEAPKLFLNN